MAYICTKGIKCSECEHYRFDEDLNRPSCSNRRDEQYDYALKMLKKYGSVKILKDGTVIAPE